MTNAEALRVDAPRLESPKLEAPRDELPNHDFADDETTRAGALGPVRLRRRGGVAWLALLEAEQACAACG